MKGNHEDTELAEAFHLAGFHDASLDGLYFRRDGERVNGKSTFWRAGGDSTHFMYVQIPADRRPRWAISPRMSGDTDLLAAVKNGEMKGTAFQDTRQHRARERPSITAEANTALTSAKTTSLVELASQLRAPPHAVVQDQFRREYTTSTQEVRPLRSSSSSNRPLDKIEHKHQVSLHKDLKQSQQVKSSRCQIFSSTVILSTIVCVQTLSILHTPVTISRDGERSVFRIPLFTS